MEMQQRNDLIAATNPRSGRIDYRFAPMTPDVVAQIATEVRTEQPGWAARPLDERLAILDRLVAEIARGRDAILAALVADTGRYSASAMEVDAPRALVDRWLRDAPAILAQGPEYFPHRYITARAYSVPYPLVGVITPWNSPLGLSMIDAIPALVAGCGVIVKPSEVTPRFVAPLCDAINAVPEIAGVFRWISGTGETGAALVSASDYICFTGSVETGRMIGQACGARLIPASLELGGKDAAIVLEGSDLDRAAAGIFWSATFNSGQLCHSIERIYVARSIAQDFIERILTLAKAMPLALAAPDAAGLGPFIDRRQAAKVEAQLGEAVAAGATVLAGHGIERHGGAVWCRPTVLTNVDHGMAIMTEETFAPVLPVMPFDTADEAVALANDSRYGLSASIWGPEAKALALARRVRAGGISINDVSLPSIFQGIEKNAFGASGCGSSRMGQVGLGRFTRSQAIFASQIEGHDPWWK